MAGMRIHLVGSWERGLGIEYAYRHRVEINGQPIGLPPGCFHVLGILCFGRCDLFTDAESWRPGGWVHIGAICQPPAYARKYVYMTVKELSGQVAVGEDLHLFENDRSNFYRVATPPASISFDRDTMLTVPDSDLQTLAALLPNSK